MSNYIRGKQVDKPDVMVFGRWGQPFFRQAKDAPYLVRSYHWHHKPSNTSGIHSAEFQDEHCFETTLQRWNGALPDQWEYSYKP